MIAALCEFYQTSSVEAPAIIEEQAPAVVAVWKLPPALAPHLSHGVYVCIYTYIICVHVCVQCLMHVCCACKGPFKLCVHVCACVHMFMCAGMHARMRACADVHTCKRTTTLTCMRVCVHAFIHEFVHACMRACTLWCMVALLRWCEALSSSGQVSEIRGSSHNRGKPIGTPSFKSQLVFK